MQSNSVNENIGFSLHEIQVTFENLDGQTTEQLSSVKSRHNTPEL